METGNKTETYIYKLYLGNSIENLSTPIDAIELEQRGKFNVRVGTSTYTLAMQGVKVDRKVYQPGKIEVEISAEGTTEPTPEVLEQLLLKRIAKLVVFPSNVLQKDVDKVTITVAENYYVQEVIPQFVRQASGSNQIFVKLVIYSVDKLMTLSKYSRVHVAKKLGDIMTTEAKTFGFKEAVVATDTSAMLHLKYKHSNTGKDTEFIHPYLVQYNETFYEFLARTANRCGEFLFFENGKLILGLPGAAGEAKLIENYHSLTFQSFSESPKNVNDYRRDSVKSPIPEADLDLNFGNEERKNNYPTDIFKFNKDQHYNMEIGEDEYLYPLYRGKADSQKRQMGYDTPGHGIASTLMPALVKALNCDGDVAKLAQGIVADNAKFALMALKTKDFVNSLADKTLDEEFKEKPEQVYGTLTNNNTEVSKVDRGVSFGSIDTDAWPTTAFYSKIHKAQVEKQRKMVCIDMGTAYVDLKLGQKIQLREKNADGSIGTTYIITQIKQTADQEWQRNYRTYGDNDTDIYKGSQSMLVYAIPEDKNDKGKITYYPPLREQPLFRQGEPQTAFVVDNGDPKVQGRVRIVYPWQTPNYDVQQKLIEAYQELYKVQQTKEAADKNYAKWKKALMDLKAIEENMDKIDKGALADELNKDRFARMKVLWGENQTGGLIKADQDKIEANEKKITELSKRIEEMQGKTDKEEPDRNTIITAADLEKNQLELENERLEKGIKQMEAEYKELKELAETIKAYGLLVYNGKKNEAEAKKKELAQKSATTEEAVTDAEKKVETANSKVGTVNQSIDRWTDNLSDELKKMASPWIRVATPMASVGGGTYFKPQTGDEVLVNYDNGNVEHPYVVGSLFSKDLLEPTDELNREYKPGLSRRPTMTIMSPGGHALTFNDASDTSKFIGGLYPGFKVLSGFVFPYANPKLKMGKDGKDLGGGIRLGDRYGMYSIEMSSHDRKISISSPMGNVAIDAFQGISVSAPNGDITIKGKNVKIEAGNNLSLLSGTNIKPASDKTKGEMAAGIALGFLQANADNVTKTFLAPFGDLSLIRNIIEVFVRPIEGTACIKSKRYLKLEAGPGSCTIKSDRMKDSRSQEQIDKDNSSEMLYDVVQAKIQENESKILDFRDKYKSYWTTACDRKNAYLTAVRGKLTNVNDPNIIQKAWEMDEFRRLTADIFNGKYVNPAPTEEEKADMLEAANIYARFVLRIKKLLNSFEAQMFENMGAGELTDIYKRSITANKDFLLNKWKDEYGNGVPATDKFLVDNQPGANDPFFNANFTILRRLIAAKFLYYVANTNRDEFALLKVRWKLNDITEKEVASNYEWKKFVGKMDAYIQNKVGSWAIDTFLKPIADKFNYSEWKKLNPRYRDIWASGKDGQILFSDSKERTSYFNNGNIENTEHAKSGNVDLLKKYLTSIK